MDASLVAAALGISAPLAYQVWAGVIFKIDSYEHSYTLEVKLLDHERWTKAKALTKNVFYLSRVKVGASKNKVKLQGGLGWLDILKSPELSLCALLSDDYYVMQMSSCPEMANQSDKAIKVSDGSTMSGEV